MHSHDRLLVYLCSYVYLFISLFVYLFVCLFVYLFVYLFVRLFTYLFFSAQGTGPWAAPRTSRDEAASLATAVSAKIQDGEFSAF